MIALKSSLLKRLAEIVLGALPWVGILEKALQKVQENDWNRARGFLEQIKKIIENVQTYNIPEFVRNGKPVLQNHYDDAVKAVQNQDPKALGHLEALVKLVKEKEPKIRVEQMKAHN